MFDNLFEKIVIALLTGTAAFLTIGHNDKKMEKQIDKSIKAIGTEETYNDEDEEDDD